MKAWPVIREVWSVTKQERRHKRHLRKKVWFISAKCTREGCGFTELGCVLLLWKRAAFLPTAGEGGAVT